MFSDKTMANKLMYIPNDDAQNYTFWFNLVIDTQFNEPPIKIQKMSPKLRSNENIVIKLWGLGPVINSLMSPPPLANDRTS